MKFKTTPAFRKALARLSRSQKESAKKAFAVFRLDPFDPRLKTHKIHHLSALYKKTIYAVRGKPICARFFMLMARIS